MGVCGFQVRDVFFEVADFRCEHGNLLLEGGVLGVVGGDFLLLLDRLHDRAGEFSVIGVTADARLCPSRFCGTSLC